MFGQWSCVSSELYIDLKKELDVDLSKIDITVNFAEVNNQDALDRIVIISDMEFDTATYSYEYRIDEKLFTTINAASN